MANAGIQEGCLIVPECPMWLSRRAVSANVALGCSAFARSCRSCSIITTNIDGEHPMELHEVRYFLAVANTLTGCCEHAELYECGGNVQRHPTSADEGCVEARARARRCASLPERQLTHPTELGKAVLPMLERALASTEAVQPRAREFQKN